MTIKIAVLIGRGEKCECSDCVVLYGGKCPYDVICDDCEDTGEVEQGQHDEIETVKCHCTKIQE